jgi:hypothetical protein
MGCCGKKRETLKFNPRPVVDEEEVYKSPEPQKKDRPHSREKEK